MIRIAGVFGATAVLAGAFGAHALKTRLDLEHLAVWSTGAQYHLVHAVAMLVLAIGARRETACRLPFRLLAAGTVLFSGSLYALALSGIRPLGAITPLGGLLLVAGWASLIWAFRKDPRRPGGDGPGLT